MISGTASERGRAERTTGVGRWDAGGTARPKEAMFQLISSLAADASDPYHFQAVAASRTLGNGHGPQTDLLTDLTAAISDLYILI